MYYLYVDQTNAMPQLSLLKLVGDLLGQTGDGNGVGCLRCLHGRLLASLGGGKGKHSGTLLEEGLGVGVGLVSDLLGVAT